MAIPSLVPKTLSDAYDTYVSADIDWLSPIILGIAAFGMAIAGIMGTIGLFLLKRWSRSLMLVVTVGAFACYPFLGAMVQSGWAYMLIEVSMTMWGAVLAMAYFSELKIHFERA
jgi:uncharacterized transporter YbjL